MWHVDLDNRTAEHESGFCLRSDGADRWVILNGEESEELFESGKQWYLHFYSKDYIEHIQEKHQLTLSNIAKITQQEINNNPTLDFGFRTITEQMISEFLINSEPLFPIGLCSLIRRAVYFQCTQKHT